MSAWQVVPLEAEHVHSLAQCHIECWREAYQDLVPAHVLDAFDVGKRAEAWEKIRVNYPGRTVVAVIDDTVIGFASSGPSRDESPVAERELSAMYVRKAWYGTGVAQDLMKTVLAQDADTSLWVFEENPRARAFYRKYGFELEGERRVEAFTPSMEVRMVRRITG
ncbi:GNAT family N-acetyltransferase [Nocardia sp. SYP-A9097]|uniref:GNAT family N-acetyltransferase n=1 Tax=Nocardia sp. SYP-A9097 TaxID=2663237 RepID=UPI00129BD520|nr:GNAT family N-acetyltransferase [Nocardia sp. SYP-A9097]MRH91023.1 GNAT family N-acetyltransferase [Nocardia sp. SYP-A9097]